MRKKFLAALLATSLVLTIAPVMPAGMGAVAVAEEKTELDCNAFLEAQTDGQEVTESGITITFKSTSYADAKENWNSPVVIAYTGDEAKFQGTGYKEYVVVRSDDWAWGPEGVGDKTTATWTSSGYNMTSNAGSAFDWAAWLAANKAGTDCKVHAVKKDGKITIEFTNGTLTSSTSFPVETGKKVYISLSGEKCKLSNIKTSGAETSNTQAPSASVTPGASSAPDASATPGTSVTPATSATPGAIATTAPTGTPSASTATELVCDAFLGAQTDGQEVTESGIAITFKNTSDTTAINNWETPVVIAYTGDEPKFQGAGYKEYVVVRSDNWAWGPEGVGDKTATTWASSGYSMTANIDGPDPYDFAAWLASNIAGTDCKVQAVKKDGKVFIEFTNGGITSTTSFPVAAGEKIYISLSGEKCKLTDIKTANFTGIGNTPSTPDPGTPDPGTPEDPGDDNIEDNEPEAPAKKSIKVSGIVAKANTKKITGKVSVSGAKVTVKVGNAKFKAAKVKGKKFTFNTSKLKKGTKIKIKATKKNYKTVTKNTKVK